MSEQTDFQPYTTELGITGSSYRLQMGKVNEYWAIRLVKGKSVLDSYIFKDNTEMPNANRLTGWVLSVLVLPNINTYQIQKTVGFIRQKALRREEDMKLAKKSAGKSESKEVKLEKTPEKMKKRPTSKGIVKDVEDEDGKIKVDAEAVSPSLAASNKAASSQSSNTPATVVIGDRELPMIPRGSNFVSNPASEETRTSSKASPSTSNTTSTASSPSAEVSVQKIEVDVSEKDILTALLKSSEYRELLNRTDTLEQKMVKLQQQNELLKNDIDVLKKK